jgi:hypothetical protein
MEVLGINDIRNCVSKGDVMACASTVANIIPWGKIFKLPKIIKAFKKAYDAISAFGDKLKAANNVLRRADEAASAATSPGTSPHRRRSRCSRTVTWRSCWSGRTFRADPRRTSRRR